ncbi:MAG: hypothetical protein H7836_00215 [Magnetococcus sp. YQC-3]
MAEYGVAMSKDQVSFKDRWKFCGTVSVAGIDRAWKDANEEEAKSDYYDPATFTQTLAVVYSYLCLPWAWRRKQWTEYLSFLAKMLLDNVAKRPLTPDQVEKLAVAVLYLNRLSAGKRGELKRLWHDWERLNLVQNLLKQAMNSETLTVGSATSISLYISHVRFIDDRDKREESLYTLEKMIEKSLPGMDEPCMLASIFREYALLCTEFANFHQDALVALARSRMYAEPFLDARVRTLMAWPSVWLKRRY